MAIAAWRKQQRIQLLQTIALVTASSNPEQAQTALRKLIEEMFPEAAKDRENFVQRGLEMMEREKSVSYSVTPVGSTLRKQPGDRIRDILGKQRRTRERHKGS